MHADKSDSKSNKKKTSKNQKENMSIKINENENRMEIADSNENEDELGKGIKLKENNTDEENTLMKEYVTEGKANIKLCNDDKSYSAFYNPAQEFNRDLSVAAINSYFKFLIYKPKKFDEKTYKFSII
jgi:hypothetical protein